MNIYRKVLAMKILNNTLAALAILGALSACASAPDEPAVAAADAAPKCTAMVSDTGSNRVHRDCRPSASETTAADEQTMATAAKMGQPHSH
jgi:hypothetical protein